VCCYRQENASVIFDPAFLAPNTPKAWQEDAALIAIGCWSDDVSGSEGVNLISFSYSVQIYRAFKVYMVCKEF
jgi:hypothetical protein